jgi:hypothetical protein
MIAGGPMVTASWTWAIAKAIDASRITDPNRRRSRPGLLLPPLVPLFGLI